MAKNTIPGTRFQETQEPDSVVEGAQKAATGSSYALKEHKTKGTVLKQQVIADVVTGEANAGGVTPGVGDAASYGLKANKFSGDTNAILGNVSGTPGASEPYQGKSRIDKRISDANKDINYMASEQIIVGYDSIPPLSQSNSTVGYDGTPKNLAARAQKKTGHSSAELLFERSLDFITKDMFVFSSGQVVKQGDVVYQDYPTKTYNTNGEEETFSLNRGNYSPRSLVIKVKKDAETAMPYLSSFEITEDDFCCESEFYDIVNKSATNHVIDINNAEITRQQIDHVAGSPNSPIFNPLGRSISEPSRTVLYLQDLEAVTGAEVFAAYRFANKARGHYLNRTIKDGQDTQGPALDALYGHLCSATDLKELKGLLTDLNELYSKTGASKGSAAMMLSIFDSLGKYKTKADIVNQPRSLKMHLKTAADNIYPFNVKEKFVSAINAVDCYSTIDCEYDPTLPVYITDNVRLIHPYSWKDSLKFTRSKAGDPRTYTSKVFGYYYAANSGLNSYHVTCGEPVLNGIAWFLEQHVQAIWNAVTSDKTGEKTIEIPIVHSTTHFSLWDYIVCAATPYILYERANTMRDIIDYEVNKEYPFFGMIGLKEADPLAPTQYGKIDPLTQLSVGVMDGSTAMSWKYPEVLQTVGGYYMLPYYFNERSYDFDDDPKVGNTLKYNYTQNHSTPVVRSGLIHNGLASYFDFDAKDHVIMTDRMMRIPGNNSLDSFIGAIYKYSQDADGLVLVKDFGSVTVQAWCATPRLLGWYFDAPAGLCRVSERVSQNAAWGVIKGSVNILVNDMRPSFTAVQYRGYINDNDVLISAPLSKGAVNVNRGQAFTQTYAICFAGGAKSSKFDIVLSMNECLAFNNETNTPARFITLDDKTQFNPIIFGEYALDSNGNALNTATALISDADARPIVFTPHYMMWSILQKTPFVINPFDAHVGSRDVCDPFGLMYCLGLAGFVAANFDEELYNRANAVQNLRFGYTEDPITKQNVRMK